MATAEISITVRRPLEEVFAYIVAIDKLHEWTPVILDSWPLSGNPPEVGSTYMVKAKAMGRIMEIPSEVTGYEPNRMYAYKSYGALSYEDTITFAETEAGTLVTEHLDMRSDGWFSRLLDPLKLIISKRSHQKSQQLLKTILESDKVVAGTSGNDRQRPPAPPAGRGRDHAPSGAPPSGGPVGHS